MRSFWAGADNDNMWGEKDETRTSDLAFTDFFKEAYENSKDTHWAKVNKQGLAANILTNIQTVWDEINK